MKMQRSKVKAASWAVLSTDHVHCDSGGTGEAFFGAGTKLTVLGKKPKHMKTRTAVEVFL